MSLESREEKQIATARQAAMAALAQATAPSSNGYGTKLA